jgi:hypothetical protein
MFTQCRIGLAKSETKQGQCNNSSSTSRKKWYAPADYVLAVQSPLVQVTVKNDAAQHSAAHGSTRLRHRTCLCLASTALAWHLELELELVACGRKKLLCSSRTRPASPHCTVCCWCSAHPSSPRPVSARAGA